MALPTLWRLQLSSLTHRLLATSGYFLSIRRPFLVFFLAFWLKGVVGAGILSPSNCVGIERLLFSKLFVYICNAYLQPGLAVGTVPQHAFVGRITCYLSIWQLQTASQRARKESSITPFFIDRNGWCFCFLPKFQRVLPVLIFSQLSMSCWRQLPHWFGAVALAHVQSPVATCPAEAPSSLTPAWGCSGSLDWGRASTYRWSGRGQVMMAGGWELRCGDGGERAGESAWAPTPGYLPARSEVV